MVHGTRDVVVPFEQGKELFERANQPKEFHALTDAGHNDLYQYGFLPISLDWLSRLPQP